MLVAPPSARASSADALPVLTRVRDIRGLSLDDAARSHPVRIRGVVTYLDERWPSGLVLHDGTAGQFVLYAEPYFRTHPKIDLRVGDEVEVEGRTVRGGFAPDVDPTAVRRLGPGALPRPEHLPYGALLTGRHDCEYVEVSGIGQRAWPLEPPAGGMFLEVAVDGGLVRASLRDVGPGDLTRFVDARVRLTGNVGALFGEAGQLRGVTILAGRTADVAVLQEPPPPFELPVREIASLYRYSSGGEVDRRVRLRGVVTAQFRGTPVEVSDFTSNTRYREVRHVIYLRDETGAARVETTDDAPLAPGDTVEVAGFPIVTPTKPALRNAIYQRLAPGDAPRPRPLDPAHALTPDDDALLVTAEARVLGIVASPGGRALVLQMGETPFEATAEGTRASLAELATGSIVAVTGVYAYQSGPPPSFRLLLRSPADVVLRRAAPWWTTRHTLVVLAIVAACGAVALVWVRAIAARHRREREQYRAILEERSRLARELHDTVEQGLAGISLQLEAVSGSLDATPAEARRALRVAREMLRYSMEEARRSVMDLRSQALEDRDLACALSDLAARMTDGTTLHAEVRVVGAPRALDSAAEHHLFRIGVEALTNAVKHAHASRVDVELRFDGPGTRLVVSDDGHGFATGTTPGGHFGLRGIRERVDKLGGRLALGARPGGGTTLVVDVPPATGAGAEA